MQGGVAPAFAEADPLSRDGRDIVLSERAKRPIRWHPYAGSVGRRGAALRRPSPVLGTSADDRDGSTAAVLGSNKIVSVTPASGLPTTSNQSSLKCQLPTSRDLPWPAQSNPRITERG